MVLSKFDFSDLTFCEIWLNYIQTCLTNSLETFFFLEETTVTARAIFFGIVALTFAIWAWIYSGRKNRKS